MVGHILRQEREKQNFTVKDVERETSIRALYISSIEEGKYDVLPGEVYLKGFIKTYANFLGLDGAAMLKLYYEEKSGKAAVPSTTPAAPVPPIERMEAEPMNAASAKDPEKNSTPAESPNEEVSVREKVKSAQRERSGKFKKSLALAAVLFVAAGVGYWSFASNAKEPTPPPVQNKKQAATDVKKQKPPVPAPVKQAQVKGVEITAKYTGRSWTQVVADNKTIYEGTPGAGESFTWKAEKTMMIRSGNAGAVEVTHNGKSIGKLGDSGEVVAKNFTPDKVTNAK